MGKLIEIPIIPAQRESNVVAGCCQQKGGKCGSSLQPVKENYNYYSTIDNLHIN